MKGEIAISRLPVTAGGYTVTRQDRLPLPNFSPGYHYQKKVTPNPASSMGIRG